MYRKKSLFGTWVFIGKVEEIKTEQTEEIKHPLRSKGTQYHCLSLLSLPLLLA
jgi:hypothetical protein